MKKHQKKQAGFIVSAELILIATILVIGLIVGMVAVRDATNAELEDVAEAIGALDQSYFFFGVEDSLEGSWTAGSAWADDIDGAGFGGDGDSVSMTRVQEPDGELVAQ